MFCRGAAASAAELADFLDNSADGLLGQPLELTPPIGDPALSEPDWSMLELRSGESSALIAPVRDEASRSELTAAAIFAAEGLESAAILDDRLRATAQIYQIDLTAPDDAFWDLMDAFEAYLADEFEGVIQSDQGFYDSGLRQIA